MIISQTHMQLGLTSPARFKHRNRLQSIHALRSPGARLKTVLTSMGRAPARLSAYVRKELYW